MKYLHTMVRVSDLDQVARLLLNKLGMKEVRRLESQQGRFTLVYLAAPGDEDGAESSSPIIGTPKPMARAAISAISPIEVDDIYATCERLMKNGVTINRPPRDGYMAFIRSPDNISIEFLQKGQPSPSRSLGPRCRTPASGRGSARIGAP